MVGKYKGKASLGEECGNCKRKRDKEDRITAWIKGMPVCQECFYKLKDAK